MHCVAHDCTSAAGVGVCSFYKLLPLNTCETLLLQLRSGSQMQSMAWGHVSVEIADSLQVLCCHVDTGWVNNNSTPHYCELLHTRVDMYCMRRGIRGRRCEREGETGNHWCDTCLHHERYAQCDRFCIFVLIVYVVTGASGELAAELHTISAAPTGCSGPRRNGNTTNRNSLTCGYTLLLRNTPNVYFCLPVAHTSVPVLII